MGDLCAESAQERFWPVNENDLIGGFGRGRRTPEILELVCQVHTSPTSKSRPPGKHPLDPGQTSFDLGPMPAPPVPAIATPPAKESPAVPKRNPKATPATLPADRRASPRRARISFEAPLRLNRRLERVALEKDRTKTSLLRDAVEAYLKQVDTPEDES